MRLEKAKIITSICLFLGWMVILLFLNNLDDEELYGLYILGVSTGVLLLVSLFDFSHKKKYTRHLK